MKEQTYGWYPPAKSIWDQRKEVSTYHKECLYKHQNSRYNDQPGVASPLVPAPIRAMYPPTPPTSSRPAPTAFARTHSAQHPVDGLSICGVRPPSVGTSAQKKMPQVHRSAWAEHLAATDISVPQYFHGSQCATPLSSVCPTPVHNPPATSGTVHEHADQFGSRSPSRRADRTQSATQRRPRAPPPPRPTKSASSCRPGIQPSTQQPAFVCEHPKTKPNDNPPSPPPSPPLSSAQAHPYSQRPDVPPPADYDDQSVANSERLDYEEQREKYGWRFEVPGDPYGLKRPCLAPRLPYTVKLRVPKVKPNPPTGHMENYDTYFYNTIPRKLATFNIHKEWVSEVLTTKRLQLQKRDGMNYNFKQYAFIY